MQRSDGASVASRPNFRCKDEPTSLGCCRNRTPNAYRGLQKAPTKRVNLQNGQRPRRKKGWSFCNRAKKILSFYCFFHCHQRQSRNVCNSFCATSLARILVLFSHACTVKRENPYFALLPLPHCRTLAFTVWLDTRKQNRKIGRVRRKRKTQIGCD